jgi:pimeloyl-ACP methyl ester carboxylesterase
MHQILLLHGAIGSMEQLKELEHELSSSFIVHNIDLNGHGSSVAAAGSFSIPLFAKQVLEFLDRKYIDEVNIFGYSMGGYVGMFLAKHYPERMNKLITLATKFHWDEATAEKEIKMLDAGKIEQKIPAFADTLKKRHYPGDWKIVLSKTIDMLSEMGHNNPLIHEDYKTIGHPALIMLGDRDKMVTLQETLDVYKELPNGSLSIMPGTPHPIETVNISRLAFEIRTFLG